LALRMMTKNDTLIKYYADLIKKWEASGYIERIVDPNPTRKDLWYWAHFPVVKEEKETTKVCTVFDGAAKFKGSCINDYIHTGPTVMNELVSVVHRFRQYDFAITGDVRKMFLQVPVPEGDKDYLRFLWYEEGKIVIYCYKVHLFGKCDSPCVAMAAIFLQSLKHKDEFPEAFQTIAKASLVDDMAKSRPREDITQELLKQLLGFFPVCAMDIKRFVENSYVLLKELPSETSRCPYRAFGRHLRVQ
jgi:hypothetical protein